MREVSYLFTKYHPFSKNITLTHPKQNFSIPLQNKASVGITATLYDRRALDCTSTLPLINSLNSLAHLTFSSPRIREILTIDGGVERLVCLLKNGRPKGDMMETYKWNLAFQCIVNIGVRGSDGRGSDSQGSEHVRTRLVEADIVPVIATMLDNFNQVAERCRAQAQEADMRRGAARFAPAKRTFSGDTREARGDRRREAPPPIAIPPIRAHQPPNPDQIIQGGTEDGEITGPLPSTSITSPADHPPFPRAHHHRRNLSSPSHFRLSARPQPATHTRQSAQLDPADVNLMPPMTATSQPDTPLTPLVPQGVQRPMQGAPAAAARATPSQPSIVRTNSTSGESDEDQATSGDDPMVGIQDGEPMEGVTTTGVVDATTAQPTLAAPNLAANPDGETFEIAPVSADATIIDSTAATPNPGLRFSPAPAFGLNGPTPDPPSPIVSTDRNQNLNVLPFVPRDEDIVLSLQLLAYVSKYCELRTYFQQTHLVPRLRIMRDLQRLAGEIPSSSMDVDEDNDEEYCQPNSYNIFPLVEKFTEKHNPSDMKYWAGVVMRNLCRKDKSRGDIRQCAYYKCGKWEQYARQFAKCRRCRQTKYCSKECQKR